MTDELSPVAARQHLVAELHRMLVGPLDEAEEILSDPPAYETAYDRYHLGFLSPAGTLVESEADEEGQEAANDDSDSRGIEDVLTLANLAQQSAAGLTFHVSALTDRLKVVVSYGLYEPGAVAEPVAVVDPTAEIVPTASAGRRPAKRVTRWIRRAFRHEVHLALNHERTGNDPVEEWDGVQLYSTSRDRGEVRAVTVSVVNRKPPPPPRSRDLDHRIYQLHIEISHPDGQAIFVPAPRSRVLKDAEELNAELLYRNRREFAVGHGCAVSWELVDPQRASRVSTSWIPAVEVPKASAAIMEDEAALDLDFLVDEPDRGRVCDSLDRIVTRYSAWLPRDKDVDDIVRDFPDVLRERIRKQANDNLQRCQRAAERIQEGIALLRAEDTTWAAFRLANDAMRINMRRARLNRPPRWYVFQLAFILTCIPSVAHKDHPDRAVLDLIWFPTGGGKTEAYLGLSAFCFMYRRLSCPNPDAGADTAVITRYTLRLLTVQQFERTARLVCACEILRRKNPRELGSIPFSIGLFVGQGATPNTLSKAEELITRPDDSNPMTTLPLKDCPWCGARLRLSDQTVQNGRLITPCSAAGCDFASALPFTVVDEEIYAYPPTFVVGTVDKFANMAWEPDMRALFGRGGGVSPPDLIIQDELHLISYSLGTLVALYEIAIDSLCARNGHRPKIIGSTATIRRAEEQCRSLFAREAIAFPPQAVSADNSFFYEEDRTQPPRLYVGIHAQGRSNKHTLARLVAVLGQSAYGLTPPHVRDAFHTLVVYFNSLRELGSALVLAEDDVPRHIKSLPLPKDTPLRTFPQIRELTSLVPQAMLGDILKQLETPILDLVKDSDLSLEAVDLLMTTNMISVGVDVARLGVMIVNAQPKTTAEYIQATSRVGRAPGSAGLVVSLYNWTRARDRSHYERFRFYHDTFYRLVESSHVTPFSPRARDRALHAVLVSLARLGDMGLSAKDSAGWISDAAVEDGVRQLAQLIVDRARLIENEEAQSTGEHLRALIDRWLSVVENNGRKYWVKRQSRGEPAGMLRNPGSGDSWGLWETPRSMRDVDLVTPLELRETRSP